MDRTTFQSLRAIVYRNSGIALNDTKSAMVSSRISKRMRLLGIATHAQYLDYLVRDRSNDEIVHFLDVMATNVTSFFREKEHFRFLQEVLARWTGQGRRRFRLWSAAASSGEEPYSIAMALQDLAWDAKVDLKILATDISTRVLSAARAGRYHEDSFKKISPSMKHRYFTKTRTPDGTFYTAGDVLRDMITFRRINLARPPFPLQGNLDVVLCRNVMIYFDAETRSRLVAEMYRLLRPGGYLITGHAESLACLRTNFKSVRPSIYLKDL